MAMRLTGLMSGMDTDSMIQELVAGRKKKVDTVKKDQIRLNWQQDAWKDLNKKLKNLQSKYLNNMRFSASYSKKATNVSNSSAVSVLTGESAVNGVQSLEIEKLAKTGYLTGGEIRKKGGGDLNALSKMSDIEGFTDGGTINIKSGRKSVDINITADTTISDVLTEMKKVGVNASFDEKNQRFFISSTKSGAASDFSIVASDANGGAVLSALGLQTDLKDDIASWNEYNKYANYYVAGDRDKTLANMQTMIDATADTKTAAYLKEYKTAIASRESTQKKIDELKEKYTSQGKELQSVEVYDKSIEEKNQEIKDFKDKMDGMTPEEKEEALKTLETMEKDLEALKVERADASALASQTATLEKLNNQIADIESYVDITKTEEDDGTITYSAAATEKLTKEVEDQYYAKAENASQVIEAYNNGTLTSSAVKISGQDAVIYLNGAKFENSDNVFEINGLTITALSETKPGEKITLTTQQDTEGIYGMIKDFLKEYNSVINEMDKLYNANSSKGYEPLTSEEKYEMSDKEVEDWEKKIKDSILRRDENLYSVSSALREVMADGAYGKWQKNVSVRFRYCNTWLF